ncbi:MAG: pyruvate formate lyase family protein [Bacillota bacterium]|nr:pyruvate formate lyase family protein [Bacillota bacterium]
MAIKKVEVNKFDADDIRQLTILTDRLQKLKSEWEEAKPIVYVDDSILFTKSWKETEGLPIDLRWAMAFAKKLRECPILIRKGELIVSSLTKHVRGANVLCAMKPREILDQLEKGAFDRKLSDTATTDIDPEDARLLKKDAEYWIEHMPPNYINDALREEFGEGHFDLMMDEAMVFEGRGVRHHPDRGLFQGWGAQGGGITGPRGKVVHEGLNHVIETAKKELEKMDAEGAKMPGSSAAAQRKYYLLKSIIITCEAIIDFAKRHAELARKMAAEESNPDRKNELERIAENCEWVPANPPRNFWEAMQAVRFLHVVAWKETPERAEVTIGRLDQMLYPYYVKDIQENRITRQEAAELIGSFWLKTRENENLVTIKREHRAAPGSLLPNVTICGRDKEGNDATNEISWIVLEVMRQMKLSEPAVYVRYHEDVSDDFMKFALECNRDFGGGNPAFLNDKLGTERYLSRGIKYEDASDWYASGCLAYNLDCAEHVAGTINLNQPKILELTLNNGYDPRTKKQLGLKTGDVTKFTSFDQLYEAFFKQVEYFAVKLRRHYFIYWTTGIANDPQSGLRAAMLYEDCIPKGLCAREGGARYPETTMSWFGDGGITDTSDSLAAIKYLVFDKEKTTMAELLEALNSNWEGKEEVRQMCINAPKYGNDDDYVDDVFNHVSMKTQEILLSRPDPITGLKPFLFKGAAAGHVVRGKAIGALPNGRIAGSPLNDAGTSPMPGMDVNGPTAVINSATKVFHAWETVGLAHNMKLTKTLLNTPEKIEKVVSLIKVFMARKGWHIQFNIHSVEDLLAAKKYPDKYKNLLVRVGGYSAYFVDLPPELQDEIIARTQHSI